MRWTTIAFWGAVLYLFYRFMDHPDNRPSGTDVAAFDALYYPAR